MDKRAIFIFGFCVLFFAVAYFTTKANMQKDIGEYESNLLAYEENTGFVSNEEAISAASQEIKTTPNTVLSLKKYYKVCGHTITNNAEIPEEMVNLTKEELAKKYPSWEIESFSQDEITLKKDVDGYCNEHYLMIEEDGVIMIYTIDKNDIKTFKEKMEIPLEYLPETDKIMLKNGIYIYGLQELNKIKEDYEI